MSGPEKDEERPLVEHLIELRKRVGIALAGVVLITIVIFPLSFKLISILVGTVTDPSNLAIYDPLETILIQINFSLIAGFALGLPLILYEAYKFMEPGLFLNERRFFALLTPTSLFLFTLGASIGFFYVVPTLSDLVLTIGQGASVRPAISIQRAFNYVISIVAGLGFIFQLPLALLFAIRIELVKLETLKKRRLMVYILFFVVASIVNPDPTFITQTIVAAIFIVLYEFSLRIGYYVTPDTDAEIINFLDRFTALGPLFVALGALIGYLFVSKLGIWWVTAITLGSFIFYLTQRFSNLIIEEEKIGTIGFFTPILGPMIGLFLAEKYFTYLPQLLQKIQFGYTVLIPIIMAAITFGLEKINNKLLK
ncbi:MAG: Sec-independent protein secretion pathway component TatC [Candidatus Methanohalarchaeum thermophilum]|uniref:Sec-independent protein translocase protein TatC n=1 Tax=Methanohalarchaeum thermophilum TaxID=1903181 RepID=A0A1Q6DUQ1_METT1|nr:MAG: Sec-independent protein secretion pathway component TatC [Candidatus Methanohalarchaeum thermophilum]